MTTLAWQRMTRAIAQVTAWISGRQDMAPDARTVDNGLGFRQDESDRGAPVAT